MNTPIALHIGTPKTGSTSIQEVLYKNYDLLKKQGIIYCSNLGMTNNADIPLAAIHFNELNWDNGNLEKRGYIGKEKRELFWREVKEKISTNIKVAETIKPNFKNLLASSETFWFLNSEYHFKRLRYLFDQCGLTVAQIHVYLRPQLELLLSAASTMVRDGWIVDLESFSESHLDMPAFSYLHYHSRLCMWKDYFPESIFSTYLFNEHKSNLIEHFMDCIGVSGLSYASTYMNRSLNNTGLILASHVNKAFSHDANLLDSKIPYRAKLWENENSLASRQKMIEIIDQNFQGRASVPCSVSEAVSRYYAKENAMLLSMMMPNASYDCLNSK